jgi:hypothetical protein
MAAKVYHFRGIFGFDNKAQWPDNYDLVAEVETDKLSEAFRLTNTIDNPWWENPSVEKKFLSSGCRSTSIGDIVEINGDFYKCAPIGWTSLGER